jgi:hypothetical protein
MPMTDIEYLAATKHGCRNCAEMFRRFGHRSRHDNVVPAATGHRPE